MAAAVELLGLLMMHVEMEVALRCGRWVGLMKSTKLAVALRSAEFVKSIMMIVVIEKKLRGLPHYLIYYFFGQKMVLH